MNYFRLISISCLIMILAGRTAVAESFLSSMLPAEVGGWVSSEDQTYDRDNLFDYINGGAELYLSYDFDRLASRTYVSVNQPDIVVDVFDMKHSFNAFGVFSHAREVVDRKFGQGSQYTEGLLMFWKGRYFVSILASPETPEARETIQDIARRIEAAIEETGPLPAVLELLPPDGLIEESVRYFFHHIWLNSHYYIADENILLITEDTEAVLAAYSRDGGRTFLVLVNYGEEGEAQAAYDSFTSNYLQESQSDSAVQIEDGSWTGCRLTGDLLVAVFNAPSGQRVDELVQKVLNLNKQR